eukprot:CAMPEP_0197520790 /NCGR_PEP_ID=MMETSP1318-20131121/6115_1 /TAXON_ID=552666 /ORGANISM="Partenskyella glossopodia, Strain RCC365" /LENGTH=363 /DNA_ID=CAMNT_0043072507 /DNA_START=59 /DNA_END=1150 /DNA_ORIENTATION=+
MRRLSSLSTTVSSIRTCRGQQQQQQLQQRHQPYFQQHQRGRQFQQHQRGRRAMSYDTQTGGPVQYYQNAMRSPPNYGLVIVPQQNAYVIERLGKWNQTLLAGWYFLIPMVDKIAYVHNLKEQALILDKQTAITKDNVTISMDGVLYIKIEDPKKASYGVQNCLLAVTQLAQTTMRSEIGKMTLDKTFEERDALNRALVSAINDAAEAWGIRCLRYEIRDIMPPDIVRESMDRQAEAVRKKRAQISESEGDLQTEINLAEAAKLSAELKAEGEAKAIMMKAEATASAVQILAEAAHKDGGDKAIALRVAEQYVEAFGNLAKESTTLMLPTQAGDPSSMVAQAMGMYSKIVDNQSKQTNEDDDLH